jgi:periplasmic divalent cation tolerance protein
MSDYVVVFVTTNSEEQARAIAKQLLEQKLIACANFVPVRSMFLWEGKIQDEAEVMLILKTTAALFAEKLEPAIKNLHTYEVPEIIALPIGQGSAAYLKWINEVTGD